MIIFQNCLGIATTIIAYLLARRLYGSKVALWSGIIVAVYPTLLVYEGELLNTTLEVFLYTLTLYFIYEAVERFSFRWTIAAGLALGLAAICRPIILPFAVLFPLFLFLKQKRSPKNILSLSALFVVAVFIPILPVTFTNLTKGDEFVLISTQGGVNFYVGNNAQADGVTVVAPGPNRRVGKYNDNIWTSSVDEAELRTGKTMTQSEISNYWFGEALSYIKGNAVDAMQLFIKKFYLVFHGQEIINIKSLYFARDYSWLIQPLLWDYGLRFPGGLLFPLMFVGIVIAIKQRRSIAPLVCYLLVIGLLIAAFFACARFRQPLIPIAIIFAVFGSFSLYHMLKTKKKAIGAPIIAGTLGIILCNWGSNQDSDANIAHTMTLVGNAYIRKGEAASAVPYLEKSFEILPENGAVYELLTQAYLETKEYVKGEAMLNEIVKRYPTYPPYHNGLGEFAYLQNDFEKAKLHFLEAVRLEPTYTYSLDRLAEIYERQHKYDSAVIFYTRLTEAINNKNPDLLQRIDMLKERLQRMR